MNRLAIDLDLNPGGLSLGNGDLDLRYLVFFLLAVVLVESESVDSSVASSVSSSSSTVSVFLEDFLGVVLVAVGVSGVVSGVEDAQPRRSTTMSTISSNATAPMPA